MNRILTLALLLFSQAVSAQTISAPFILTGGSTPPAVTFGIEDTVSVAAAEAASITQSFTITNADLIVVRVTATFSSMTSVTWNGSALTQQIAREYSGFGSFIYTLANPATGTHNIVVTPAGTSSMAAQITGVKKTHNTTPVSGATYAEGTSTAPSVNVTSASGALVFDCLCSNNDTPLPTLTVGAGQTQQAKRTSGSYNSGAFSKEDGAGTTAMSWTISASREWVTTAISVNPE